MAKKARTTRMSCILPRKFDETTLPSLGEVIRDHNKRESDVDTQRQFTGGRIAPIHIMKLGCLPGDDDTTLCLFYTNGKQYEFTRWYGFLKSVFGFVERMDQKDKLEQIREYTTRMRHLDSESTLTFDVPHVQRSSTAGKRDFDGEEEEEGPPLKQLALSRSGKPCPAAPSRAHGSSPATMHQTVLVGSSQPPVAKQAPSVVPEISPESFFTQRGDAVAKLCDFFLGKHAVYKAVKTVDGRRDDESAEDYRRRVRKECNVVPVGMKIVTAFLPPILTSHSSNAAIFTTLPAGHVDLLMALQRMFSPARGVYSPFFLPADSQELSYGVDCALDGDVARGSCFLELWRRALKLEAGLADLVAYLMEIVKTVSQHKLVTVSPRTLGNVRALLASGAGLHGGGSGYWTDCSAQCLSKLQEGGDPDVLSMIQWLSRNRQNAFKALYPCVDELGAILPILAQVVGIKDALGGIGCGSIAQQVVSNFSDEHKLRVTLYRACCTWLIAYGGRLSSLVGQVNSWCGEFVSISKELKLEKPSGVTVLTLSEGGKVIGLDGQPLANGHVDASWKGGLLPFPEYCLAVLPVPMDRLEEMLMQRRAYEDTMIQDMLQTPCVKEALAAHGQAGGGDGYSHLCVFKLVKQGVNNIAAWFRDDSHKKMLTCYLPSTASMQEAVYSPDQIYKAK